MKKSLNINVYIYGVCLILLFFIGTFVLAVHAQEENSTPSPQVEETITPTPEISLEPTETQVEEIITIAPSPQPTEASIPTPTLTPTPQSFLDNALHFIGNIFGLDSEGKTFSQQELSPQEKIIMTKKGNEASLWIEDEKGARSLVAGPDMINDGAFIGTSAGTIVWADLDRKVLYGYSIASQGSFSSSYDEKNGENYLMFKNESGEKVKATFENKEFTFENLH